MGTTCEKAMNRQPQRRILICGYYERRNYGDDAFVTTLAKQWKDERCSFYNIETVPEAAVAAADLIVLGGGDLLQEYFIRKVEANLLPYKQCPIYAVGVSMPYLEALEQGRLDCIDKFWCRCQTDYQLLTQRYGDSRVTLIPDLALLNPLPVRKPRRGGGRDAKRIGLAISMSLIKGPNRSDLLVQLRNLIQRLLVNYQVSWLAFNTDSAEHESDVALYQLLPSALQRQVPLYSDEKLLPALVEMDLVIASRFHTHVFASLAEVPVVSLVLTRKVEQWNLDHHWESNALALPRSCEWCTPGSQPCNSCAAYVGWVTRLPVTEICTAVSSVRTINYNNKRDISLLQGALARILLMPWLPNSTPPYYVSQKEVSDVLRDLQSSWSKFASGKLGPEDFGSVVCLRVTGDARHAFHYGLVQQLTEKGKLFDLRSSVTYLVTTYAQDPGNWSRSLVSNPAGLFSLTKVPQHRLVGQHRAGWSYAVDQLATLHRADGPLMDTFLDRTFGWDAPYYQELGMIPYTQPWLGFLHHPPKAVFSDNDCERLLKQEPFQASLPHCLGLFVLAHDLKFWLRGQGVTVPIHVLSHPTDHQVLKFKWKQFERNPVQRVVQIGAWLRDPYAIFRLHVTQLQKTLLKCQDMKGYVMDQPPVVLPPGYSDVIQADLPIVEEGCSAACEEHEHACRDLASRDHHQRGQCLNPFLLSVQQTLVDQWRSVTIMEHLSDQDYDQLLSENVVFVPLLKAEAVNTVLDCVVRHTPLIISHLPAVVEYLGPRYPGYFTNYHEAERKLNDPSVLRACFEYLRDMDKSFLTSEYFLSHLRASLAGKAKGPKVNSKSSESSDSDDE
jgi:polysaccharide pyruvyl transferase WcaK-like protein